MTLIQFIMPVTPSVAYILYTKLKTPSSKFPYLLFLSTLIATVLFSVMSIMFYGIRSQYGGFPYNVSILVYSLLFIGFINKYKSILLSYIFVYATAQIWEIGIFVRNLSVGSYDPIISSILFLLDLTSIIFIHKICKMNINLIAPFVSFVIGAIAVGLYPNFYLGLLTKSCLGLFFLLSFSKRKP